MKATSPTGLSGKVFLLALSAFQVISFSPLVYAAPSQAVGQIQEIKTTGPGKYMITIMKGTQKTSVVINEKTIIRVAVPAESLQEGDTIWSVPGSGAAAKKPAAEAAEQEKSAQAPGMPPQPPAQPLAVPPPKMPPQPPKMPPQPPEIPEMPQPPQVPPPPEIPKMPGQQAAPPPEGEMPAGDPAAAEKPEKQAPQKEEKEFPVEEPDPDSLAPDEGPLTGSENATEDETAAKAGDSAKPDVKGKGASKVIKTEKAEDGIHIELENEAGEVEEQVYAPAAPLLKLSDVEALLKGMIAHIEYSKDEKDGFLAQNVTATSKDSLRAA